MELVQERKPVEENNSKDPIPLGRFCPQHTVLHQDDGGLLLIRDHQGEQMNRDKEFRQKRSESEGGQ